MTWNQHFSFSENYPPSCSLQNTHTTNLSLEDGLGVFSLENHFHELKYAGFLHFFLNSNLQPNIVAFTFFLPPLGIQRLFWLFSFKDIN